MKKLILSAAVVLGSLSIYATTVVPVKPAQVAVSIQEAYTEINPETIPAVVKTALDAAYPGAKLVKAYVNEKKEYKLEISVGDQKATVYSDVNGNWLKI